MSEIGRLRVLRGKLRKQIAGINRQISKLKRARTTDADRVTLAEYRRLEQHADEVEARAARTALPASDEYEPGVYADLHNRLEAKDAELKLAYQQRDEARVSGERMRAHADNTEYAFQALGADFAKYQEQTEHDRKILADLRSGLGLTGDEWQST